MLSGRLCLDYAALRRSRDSTEWNVVLNSADWDQKSYATYIALFIRRYLRSVPWDCSVNPYPSDPSQGRTHIPCWAYKAWTRAWRPSLAFIMSSNNCILTLGSAGWLKYRFMNTVKTKPPFWGMLAVGGVKPRVVRTWVIFQDRPMFSHINGKLSPRLFYWYGWT